MGNQGDQSILLAPAELAEALQKLAFSQAQIAAVERTGAFSIQCAFLYETLLETRDDFGVHAPVMVSGYLGNALTHAVRESDYKLVSRAAGIGCLFHRAHTLNPLAS